MNRLPSFARRFWFDALIFVGMGISIVTSICLTGADPLTAIPFNRYFPERTYGLVLRKDKMLSPPATRFVELIKGGAQRDRPR